MFPMDLGPQISGVMVRNLELTSPVLHNFSNGSSLSRFEWFPVLILPKFSMIPPFGFSFTNDPLLFSQFSGQIHQ